ncbi:MAG: Thymidylate kinase [Chlamydiia bacterium]|nr:Thymidylate kinase [Chlamydiia bacterium]
MKKGSGLFVTFEGGEGAGKTTLIKSLHEYLNSLNKQVLSTFEPGDSEFGKSIRDTLLFAEEAMPSESEFFLYLADRAYHVENMILPALEKDVVVLCDRFTDSSVAYQGAGRQFVSLERIEEMSLVSTKGLSPDMTFLLDIEPAKALLRLKGKKDRLESENIAFHERVREGYLTLAAENPHRIIVLDAEKSKEELFKQAKDHLDSFLVKAGVK